MNIDNTLTFPPGTDVSNLKFEYTTMSVEIPSPIDYDAYRKFQPWPFNKPIFAMPKFKEYTYPRLVLDENPR